VASRGLTLPIGRCLNYAGQLEVGSNPNWLRPETDTDFAFIAKSGFQTIRVPVNFVRYTQDAPPYTLDRAFLARVRRTVDAARAAGLNVIIDDHIEKVVFPDPSAQRARFTAMWTQIATAFRDEPVGSVWFELLNEPAPPMTNGPLAAFLQPALQAVRQTNPTRPVIIGGQHWSDVPSLKTLDLLDDRYTVPTFHYYEPMGFTHQGAPFLKPVMPVGVGWGSDADYAQLDRNVAAVKDYIATTGRVPFIGEYGAYEKIPMPLRVSYYDDVTHAFAAIGVQSCVWGYANNFPIRDGKGWYVPLVDAMGATTTIAASPLETPLRRRRR
jgi:endoglucanase